MATSEHPADGPIGTFRFTTRAYGRTYEGVGSTWGWSYVWGESNHLDRLTCAQRHRVALRMKRACDSCHADLCAR